MRTYKIGRLSNNDICLPIESVSRQHADLTCMDDGTFVLTDHSMNGTFVNGRPLKNSSMSIKYGDNVVFGKTACLDWSRIQPAVNSNSKETEWTNPPINVNVAPAEPVAQESNGMAIAGFVLSFLIPLLGLIFSSIGVSRAKRLPQRTGYGLAVAGLVISIISIAIGVAAAIIISNQATEYYFITW